jgi:chromosome segregation ATPase
MIYLKKLSTGHDEDVSHKEQLEQLTERIKSYKGTELKKREELRKLKEERKRYNTEKEQEINSLRAEIRHIKSEYEEKKSGIVAKAAKDILDEDKKHKEREAKLSAANKTEKDKLAEMEAKNRDEEKLMIGKKAQAHTQFVDKLKYYDEEMEREEAHLKEVEDKYNMIHNRMLELNDEYRRVKHEQEVNAEIELEWQIKIQVAIFEPIEIRVT